MAYITITNKEEEGVNLRGSREDVGRAEERRGRRQRCEYNMNAGHFPKKEKKLSYLKRG